MSFTTGPSGVYDVFMFEERRFVRMENNAMGKTEKSESHVRATSAASTAHRDARLLSEAQTRAQASARRMEKKASVDPNPSWDREGTFFWQ